MSFANFCEIEINATQIARKRTDKSKSYSGFLVSTVEVDWAPYKQNAENSTCGDASNDNGSGMTSDK